MEDEEWEDVIVVSFVPLPITSEENVNHAKFKAIERDLTVQSFELKQKPTAGRFVDAILAWSPSPTELAVVYGDKPTEPWIYDRTAQYKHTVQSKLDPGLAKSLKAREDPSGRFVIVSHENWNPINQHLLGVRISRIDLKDGSIIKICEIDHYADGSAQECMHVNDKWAYFVAGEGFWRFDWRQSDLGKLSAQPEKYLTKWPESHSSQWHVIDIATTTADSVFFSFLRDSSISPKLIPAKILKFSQKKGIFVHGAESYINHGCPGAPEYDVQVIKEGLIMKTTSQHQQRFYSVTRLYSLSDLRLRVTFKSELTSMYPVTIRAITMMRMKGIPVFLDSFDKDGKKNLVNFIFLYGNRFHGMTFKSCVQTSGFQRLLTMHSVKVGRNTSEVIIEIFYGLRFGERFRKSFVLQIGF